MFEGTEWEWGQDWLASLAGRPLLGARPTEVADALIHIDPVALLEADEGVAEEAIATLQQALNQISALQQVFIEAFARAKDREWQLGQARLTEAGQVPLGTWTADDFVPSMLAPLLHLSPRSMATRVADARRVVNDLPVTLAAALAGDVEPWRVSVIVDASEMVSPERVSQFETTLYAARPHARDGGLGQGTAGALRARAQRVAANVDPDTAAAQARQGRTDREVRVQPGPYPGTTTWTALTPAGRSGQAWAAVCDLATEYRHANPTLTVSQARADAFLDLLLANAQVTTTVTVALTDQTITTGALCADNALTGTLIGDQVTHLLTDPTTRLRLARLDPHTGATAYLTQQTYRPGRALERLVRARDGTCRFPGCTVPATRCDIDHAIAYPDGPTDIRNLHCLCRRHHGFKHHAGWHVDLAWDGTLTWTSPTGRHYTTHPIDRRADAA